MVGLRLGREPQRLLPTARAMESENEAQRSHLWVLVGLPAAPMVNVAA